MKNNRFSMTFFYEVYYNFMLSPVDDPIVEDYTLLKMNSLLMNVRIICLYFNKENCVYE